MRVAEVKQLPSMTFAVLVASDPRSMDSHHAEKSVRTCGQQKRGAVLRFMTGRGSASVSCGHRLPIRTAHSHSEIASRPTAR